MSYLIPTVTDFKDFFTRDFPFQPDGTVPDEPENYVLDQDVQRAINEAKCYINESLFSGQDCFTNAYLYLSAHLLATNIQNSSSGLSSQYDWGATSKSVGSVSIGTQIPDSIMKDPFLAILAKTSYGVKYLSLILPLLRGNVFTVKGGTLP
tara:strand:- start:27969 stop:28421 length:453 start_codon:yes stop_codon:yes gene_type:complete